jgi:ketosteroid isomerase-like protein
MRRLVCLAALALLAGCGASDEDQIRETVANVGHAEADGEWQKVCDLMTPALQKLVVGTASQGTKTCADALEDAAATMSQDEKNKLHETHVVSVKLNGDTATVKVEPAGEFADTQPMRKVNGKWRLDRTD